jgi:protein-S-isoprenylcysteine O-methyltransferase Ste14
MYLAVIIIAVSTPLALGSFIALFFSGLIGIIFIIRTHLEEKTLQKELAGYEEYMKEVKYRMFPGIW